MLKASDIEIKGKTAQEVDAALAQIDQVKVLADTCTSLSWETWDRKTPINGVPAEDVLRIREDIPPTGEVYLIKSGGMALYFQPHMPEAAGFQPIIKVKLKETADGHVAKIAEGVAPTSRT